MSQPAATATEPPPTGAAELRAASERRLSLMDAAAGAKPAIESKGDTPKAETVSGAAPEGVSAEKENVKGGDAKPTDTTRTVATEDHKHIPEEFRSLFDAAWKDPKAAEWLSERVKEGLRLTDYRNKTTAVSKDREALKKEQAEFESRKQDAEFGAAILADDEMYDALKALWARRNGKAPAKDEATPKAFDWTTASSEEIDAHFNAKIREAEERGAKKALSEIDGREQAKEQTTAAMKAMGLRAKAELVDTGLYTVAEVDAMYDRLAGRGVSMSKENVVETLLDFLPKRDESVKKQETSHANGATNGKAGGASPLTRASGVSPPVNVPDFIRKGEIPTDVRGRRLEALFQANQMRVRRGQEPLPFD